MKIYFCNKKRILRLIYLEMISWKASSHTLFYKWGKDQIEDIFYQVNRAVYKRRLNFLITFTKRFLTKNTCTGLFYSALELDLVWAAICTNILPNISKYLILILSYWPISCESDGEPLERFVDVVVHELDQDKDPCKGSGSAIKAPNPLELCSRFFFFLLLNGRPFTPSLLS